MKSLVLCVFIVFPLLAFAQEKQSVNQCYLAPQTIVMTDTMKFGHTLTYEIVIGLSDGCARFKEVETTLMGKELRHRIIRQCHTSTLPCEDVYREISVIRTFTPQRKGRMHFTFYRGDRAVKTRTLFII